MSGNWYPENGSKFGLFQGKSKGTLMAGVSLPLQVSCLGVRDCSLLITS